MMVRSGKGDIERTLIRTIAGAARPLDEDLNLSPLQAIDRLLKLNAKFKEFWIQFPWLVLEGGQRLAANMPVPQMLSEIQKYGAPIGIAGIALLEEAQRLTTLKMMFRQDEKSRKTLEASAEDRRAFFMRRIRTMQAFDSGEVSIDISEKEHR